MSVHSALMKPATDARLAIQGDKNAATYKPTRGLTFPWTVIIGAERGGFLGMESGDLVKVTRLTVEGPTGTLVANRITELQRNATVTVLAKEWAIDLNESVWGPELVRLGLFRRVITEHEELTADATLR